MEQFYKLNNEELLETVKENGVVKAYVHGGMYTMDGTFHAIDKDTNPAIFTDEYMFMASLNREHPNHEIFTGKIV